MKAEVKSNGEIVELVTKRGEYYIDTNSNPYKEDELNFDVIINDMKSDSCPTLPPLPDFSRLLGFGNVQHGVMIAVQYMKDHPSASPRDVGMYVKELMLYLKTL